MPERCSSPGTTAATVTGPAHEPRPTSSMPTTTRSPALQHFRSVRRVGNGAGTRADVTNRRSDRSDDPLAQARSASYDAAGAPRHARRSPVPLRSSMVAGLRGRRARRRRAPRRATSSGADPTARSCRCCSTRTTCARNAAAAPGGCSSPTPSARYSESRAIRSSTGIAGSVVVRIVPRAASMIAAFAIVCSSGASMRFRKSY